MKNKTVKMLLAVMTLVLCCGAYAGVKAYVTHQEEQESQNEEKELVKVFEASEEDIKQVSFMIDKNEVVFEKNEEKEWVKSDEEKFPVNQTVLQDAVLALTDVESDRVLENAENLEQYGLDEPINTIKIKTEKSDEDDAESKSENQSGDQSEDQSEREIMLRVGDLNESSNQYYVSKNEDRETVYLVDADVIEPFTKGLYEYAQGEDFPVVGDTSLVKKITVASGEDKNYSLEKDEDTKYWSICSGEDAEAEKADSAAASSLAAALGSMAYNGFVDYECTDGSEYGLKEPFAVIDVDYQEEKPKATEDETSDELASEEAATDETDAEEAATDETDAEKTATDETTTDETADEAEMENKKLKIVVGKEAGNGSRYVQVNGSKQIYTMTEDSLSAFLGKTEADFWDMIVKYVPLDELTKLSVEYKNEKHVIDVSRETLENDDGETEEKTTYLLDGEEASEADFTTFYNKLNNMAAEHRMTDPVEGSATPEMVVTYATDEGESTVAYYPYDTNYYAAVIDEKIYMVNKMTIKSMMEAYEKMIH